LTLTETWASTNMLSTKLEMDNTLAKGLKAEVLNFFNPSKGATAFKGNLIFKQPMFHTRAFMDYAPGGNVTAVVDGVVGHEGFLVGGEVGYDVQKAAVTRYSAAVGYTTPLMSAALTATNNMSIYSASYYQKVNSAVEAGAKASYDTKSSSTIGMELASKYRIDPLSFAKVRQMLGCRSSIQLLIFAPTGQDQRPRYCVARVQHQDQQRLHIRHWCVARYSEDERGWSQGRTP